MKKDRTYGQRGQAVVEYVALLGFITFGLILVFPKFSSANQNAFLCASGGMSNPVTCTNGIADQTTVAAASGIPAPVTLISTSTTTTMTNASPSPQPASTATGCHYDNGYGNAGYNMGIVCSPTGNSNTRFAH